MNRDKLAFLYWWLFIMFVVACTALLDRYYDIFDRLLKFDSTKISLGIIVIFILTSIKCGWYAWHIEKEKIGNLAVGWFMSAMCMSLGLLGTVLGLIQMTDVFDTLNSADINTIRKLGSGLGTAFYTNAVGLICAILLRVQCYWLEKESSNEEIS